MTFADRVSLLLGIGLEFYLSADLILFAFRFRDPGLDLLKPLPELASTALAL